MKIVDGMVLHEVAGNYMAVPTGEAREVLQGLVRLNETGRDIWEGIAAGKTVEQIGADLVANYEDVTLEEAIGYTQELVNQLVEAGLVLL